MNKIVVSHLHKHYHSRVVLQDVSFKVESGTIVALLGSSGAGKSTLLRCLNQLEVPDGGSFSVDDVELNFPLTLKQREYHQALQALRRQTGMIFQQFNLWAHMTILQNVMEAPRRVLKLHKDEVEAQAIQLLTRVGLLHRKDAYPSQLSGGEQQRVAIARALMMSPQILLCDEPTSALDPEMSREVLNLLKELGQTGMTLLIATHEVHFAREVATHVMFLEKGEILEYGESATLLRSPKTERFAAFLEHTR